MKPDAQQKKNNEARKVEENERIKVKTAVIFKPKNEREILLSLENLKHVYGNKNHAGFIDGKCKGVGVGKRENRQKKIEKAVLCSSCLFSLTLCSLLCTRFTRMLSNF